MAGKREFDIVLFGASGFTGGLTAEYLARVTEKEDLRWAIAGRSRSRLEKVKQKLLQVNPGLDHLGIIVADVRNEQSLVEMTDRTRVLITTVGPYILHGQSVVQACVHSGTDYVDLTGEPEFVGLIQNCYGESAEEKHLRIVNCCGFDSIPHDLGVFYTVNELTRGMSREKCARASIKVEGFVRTGGTFSGGTWHSAIHAFSRFPHYSRQKRRMRQSRQKRDVSRGRIIRALSPRVKYRAEHGAWACPLPTIDPIVVQRTASALPFYGSEFYYGHYALVKSFPRLVTGIGAVGSVFALSQLKFTRNMLLAVKDPGDGPNLSQREKGWFCVTFMGEMGDRKILTRVHGGDPGYGDTSKMLAESALCLAKDRRRLPRRYGVITPAAAMGTPLLERLQHAGITFETG